jgi:hypothetical protein
MGRRKNGTLPSYRPHKQSGQAIVSLPTGGNPPYRDVLLGPYGSEESKREYTRVIDEWLAAGKLAPPRKLDGRFPDLTVAEVCLRFWKHAEVYYRLVDGSPSRELDHFKYALMPVVELYGREPAADFGPVRIATTRPRFGGLRWWFICPLIVNGRRCNRRVGKLYLPPAARYFGCRHCHDLTYTSCQEHDKRIDALRRHPKLMDALLRDRSTPSALLLLAIKASRKVLERLEKFGAAVGGEVAAAVFVGAPGPSGAVREQCGGTVRGRGRGAAGGPSWGVRGVLYPFGSFRFLLPLSTIRPLFGVSMSTRRRRQRRRQQPAPAPVPSDSEAGGTARAVPWSDASLSDPRLLRQAIRQGWPVPEDRRAGIMAELATLIRAERRRAAIAVAWVFLDAHEANMRAEREQQGQA